MGVVLVDISILEQFSDELFGLVRVVVDGDKGIEFFTRYFSITLDDYEITHKSSSSMTNFSGWPEFCYKITVMFGIAL
jgi:hypothetical protein